MNILIANDDGIYSAGLYELAKEMLRFGKVSVVAPDREQSAIGHAITMHQPLRCKKIVLQDLDIVAWRVSGTPADCIKIGIETLLPERPQLIVSGINKGENLGTDVIYSGTVSAAIEGSIFNIPSIAVSYAGSNDEGFRLAATAAADIIGQLLQKGLPHKLININIPEVDALEEIKGVKIARLGSKRYRNSFEERTDPRGKAYYWLAGELMEEAIEEDTDIYALRNGYITITPLHADLTGYDEMDGLRQLNIGIKP